MARSDLIEFKNCEVVDCLPAGKFKVKLPTGNIVISTLSGNLRINKIKILTGDTVTLNVSPYDITKGIITWRNY